MLALWQPERHVRARLVDRVLDRDPNAPLEFSDVVHVGVDPGFVASAQIMLERSELADDGVENARVPFPIAPPLLGARAVTEQALEDDAGIHFGRQRLGRGGPGDAVGVRAAVAPVAVAIVARVFDAELQRREDRVLPVPAGDHLVDGRSKIGADGVSPRPRPRQQDRATRMIAAGLLRGRCRLGHVEAADEHDAVAERLQRLRDEREREVFPFLERAPIARRRAMWVPDADEPLRRGRGGQPQRPECRHHRFQQRQRQRDAGATEERAPRDVFLRCKHRSAPRAATMSHPYEACFTRIRNCALRTTPRTIAENRLPSLSTSRAIARTVGMSVYSTPRPSAYVIILSMNIRTNCGE